MESLLDAIGFAIVLDAIGFAIVLVMCYLLLAIWELVICLPPRSRFLNPFRYCNQVVVSVLIRSNKAWSPPFKNE